MPEIVLFKSEERKGRAQIADFLRALADKVESGKVVLKQGGEETTIDIPAALTLEIKAEREEKAGRPDKLSLEVELEWTPGEADGASGGVELA